ncbi:anti-sigma factor domain-containing protein [Winogradskyella aurantia]|uniref:Anti-sigma K factor RskA C-terminal domain-containing protein n=1 Tax=Winogradskyella aurantia TaxID=1915063 RepID=A0A265URP0_9FLAO|nr:anti-sigma factor [Winogradskyella aurantia]OZV67978.1 hypothetical protein CA834_10000 [Winogradskyella aurantia]
MMDKKTILEKGLLEQYILGELSLEKRHQVEQILRADSKLRDVFDALERDLERLGMDNAISPPPAVKNNLLDKIKSSRSKTAQIDSQTNRTNFKFYFGIAASLAALLLVSSFWMYSELSKLKGEVQSIETENVNLNGTVEDLKGKLTQNTELYAAITHPDTKQYILEGNALMPEGKIISYVNRSTKSVVINTERLPKLDEAHDYQMWADVEGEMINMGVIDKTQPLIAMNYIDHSESLNVTIEPAGGNDHPTVERLVTNVILR